MFLATTAALAAAVAAVHEGTGDQTDTALQQLMLLVMQYLKYQSAAASDGRPKSFAGNLCCMCESQRAAVNIFTYLSTLMRSRWLQDCDVPPKLLAGPRRITGNLQQIPWPWMAAGEQSEQMESAHGHR